MTCTGAIDAHAEFLFGAEAGGFDAAVFAAWDADKDDALTNQELRQKLARTALFDQWDTDDSLGLDEREFLAVAFQLWDADNDLEVGPVEWAEAAGHWHGQVPRYGFGEWDADRDGGISAGEFERAARKTRLLAAWNTDGDGGISPEEMADRLFVILDKDRDGRIVAEEFQLMKMV